MLDDPVKRDQLLMIKYRAHRQKPCLTRHAMRDGLGTMAMFTQTCRFKTGNTH